MKKSLRLVIPALCLLLIAFLAFWFLWPKPIDAGQGFRPPMLVIDTGEKQYMINIEWAETPEEKAQGLMHRSDLSETQGMLFPYQEDLIPNFWMKNVLIPLDMLFITADKKIIHIEEASPCEPIEEGECRLYTPPVPVRYVLEISGGLAEEIGLRAGDRVRF